jgi:hypothetical protein
MRIHTLDVLKIFRSSLWLMFCHTTTSYHTIERRTMILSTFQYFVPYRLHCMVVFLICNVIFNVLLFQERLTTEIIPGTVMPDTAFTGYSPAQCRAWYLNLKEDERKMVLLLGLLDVFGIIPSYVLGCGGQLVNAECPRVLCYLPVWTASCDLIESLTTLCAVASIQYGIAWVPSFTLGECCHTIQGSLVGCLHRRCGVGFYPFRSQEESIMKFFTSDYAAVYSSAKS